MEENWEDDEDNANNSVQPSDVSAPQDTPANNWDCNNAPTNNPASENFEETQEQIYQEGADQNMEISNNSRFSEENFESNENSNGPKELAGNENERNWNEEDNSEQQVHEEPPEDSYNDHNSPISHDKGENIEEFDNSKDDITNYDSVNDNNSSSLYQQETEDSPSQYHHQTQQPHDENSSSFQNQNNEYNSRDEYIQQESFSPPPPTDYHSNSNFHSSSNGPDNEESNDNNDHGRENQEGRVYSPHTAPEVEDDESNVSEQYRHNNGSGHDNDRGRDDIFINNSSSPNYGGDESCSGGQNLQSVACEDDDDNRCIPSSKHNIEIDQPISFPIHNKHSSSSPGLHSQQVQEEDTNSQENFVENHNEIIGMTETGENGSS